MPLHSKKKIELLAPAKDKETAFAAINAGADAVYTGYLKYGARSAAGNSLEDIKEIITYAHLYKAKVYVTLNTILTDDEIDEAAKIVHNLYELEADGIIIQDMGLLECDLPPIPLIASTQCNNDSLEKIKFLEKTGFKRVILPREFSLEEIKHISQNTDIEIETFVHGALCVSYSGQCYLSSAIGGRSANRGECAQPCRKSYSLKDANGVYIAKNKHLLSLKDFNLSDNIEELITAGVSSFKIEGRLKDKAYILNVVSFYRKRIDEVINKLHLERSSIGKTYIDFEPDLYKTFNRGYTKYFLKEQNKDIAALNYTKSLGEYAGVIKEINKNYFVLQNGNIIFNNNDGICFFDENEVLAGTKILKQDEGKIFPLSMNGLKKGTKIYRNFNSIFTKKLSNSKICRKIKVDIFISENKDTLSFIINDEEGITAAFESAKSYEKALSDENSLSTIRKQFSKLGKTEFELNQIIINIKETPFIPVSDLNAIRRELVIKLKSARKIINSQDIRINPLDIVDYPYSSLSFEANILNKKAEEFYKKRGVKKIEYAVEKTKNFKSKRVMTTKHCLKYLFDLCPKTCKLSKYKEPFYLIDEHGKEYKLNFDCKNCKMEILF